MLVFVVLAVVDYGGLVVFRLALEAAGQAGRSCLYHPRPLVGSSSP